MSEIKAITCPWRKKCGGCTTIGQPYQLTLDTKLKKLNETVRPAAKVDEIVGMEDPYHYRNKVHWCFAMQNNAYNERVHVAGIYAAGTHKVISVSNCLIENEEADAILKDIVQIARKYKMPYFDEDTGLGLLRHVVIRTGHKTGQIMVVLVLSDREMPGKKNFVDLLRKKHPNIETVVINVNDQKTNMVLGERETNAYGRGFIEDELCGKRFRISSRSFYQVNSEMTEKLYGTAIEWANLTGHEKVVDAYCGIGTIGICTADKAKSVIGCELNPDACKDADVNVKRNGLKNVRIVNEDAGRFLSEMADEHEKADVIFLDPPRSGSTEEFLDAAAAVSPGRIIYISCGPESLARDLKYLKKKGYTPRKAKAFDMFPFTDHVETVVLMSRIEGK
ncbi:MAG: 23S rRNA (uracil(1939)-C(5))-methyltransferase RlmD [Lachnospiraceae bacterium]|nr:23S rRNA (uracil(1939)-C(5))-methyltransferase RlmD [Lachnospiraceae bacterium]